MGLWPTAYVSRGVSAPVSLLTRYEARRFDVEPAAKRKWPAGSRLKALGTASVATCPRAINRPEELNTRIRGLLRGGMRPEMIAEVFLQTAFYCGNPAGVEALIMLVNAVDDLRERGTLVHEPVGQPPEVPVDPRDIVSSTNSQAGA